MSGSQERRFKHTRCRREACGREIVSAVTEIHHGVRDQISAGRFRRRCGNVAPASCRQSRGRPRPRSWFVNWAAGGTPSGLPWGRRRYDRAPLAAFVHSSHPGSLMVRKLKQITHAKRDVRSSQGRRRTILKMKFILLKLSFASWSPRLDDRVLGRPKPSPHPQRTPIRLLTARNGHSTKRRWGVF